LDFLAAAGIPTVPGCLVQTPEEAVAAAQQLGYPVVLKVISPDHPHKTELGGVVLDLDSDDMVAAACRRLRPLLAGAPAGGASGILVQKQRRGRELLLGLKQDAAFGPIVVCGYGGTDTELWQDIAQTLAPLSLSQAQALLASLRSFPLLTGYRGGPAVDLEAVCRALVALAELGMAHPHLQEVDVNPLIATPQGCWAVDARLVWRKH
jgi:acetyltransferase